MTLIFGNFPHPVGMWGCVENCKTSIFLHRLVCGNPGLKKFLVRSIKIKNNVCWFLVVLLLFLLLFLFSFVWFGPISSYLVPLNTENTTWIWNGVIWFFDFVQFHVRISRHLNISVSQTISTTKALLLEQCHWEMANVLYAIKAWKSKGNLDKNISSLQSTLWGWCVQAKNLKKSIETEKNV